MKGNLNRYFQFLLVVLAAGSIYPLIYLRSNYQESILTVYNISLERLNGIYATLGIAFMVGYFPSGWLADRFSAKKLISFSLLVCGLAGLWFAQTPSYHMVILIFVIWGIFSVFTFWAAHLKMVKMIAKNEEQGRFFGMLDGGRGLVEAILAIFALFIFQRILARGTIQESLQGVIYLYSFMMIGVSILIYIFVKDIKPQDNKQESNQFEKKQKEKFEISHLVDVLKNKYVWLLGLIIFMGYNLAWMLFYLGGFLQTVVGVDAIRVGQIMVISLWMRPLGGTSGGFLTDRYNKFRILTIFMIVSAISLVLFATLPITAPRLIFYVLVVLIALTINMVRGIYWSLLSDCKIEDKILGLSIGFISLLGYIPDFLAPVVSTVLLTMYGPTAGQSAFFIFGAVMGIVGVVLVRVFKHQLAGV